MDEQRIKYTTYLQNIVFCDIECIVDLELLSEKEFTEESSKRERE